jgi:hypothetical protein
MRLKLAAFALTCGLAAISIATPLAFAADRAPISGRTQPVKNTTGLPAGSPANLR